MAKVILAVVNAALQSKGLFAQERYSDRRDADCGTQFDHGRQWHARPGDAQAMKGNQYYFGMKAHIGVEAESGLIDTLLTTPASTHDITQAQDLVHDQETDVFADAGFRGIEKREAAKDLQVNWYIAMMPAKRRVLNLETVSGQVREAAEKIKAGIRAKIEHPLGSSRASLDSPKFDIVDWPRTLRG